MKVNFAYRGFPGGSVIKNLPAKARDAGDVCSIPGSIKSPAGGIATHSTILVWRIPQRGLVVYSPLSCKELLNMHKGGLFM